MNNNKIKNIIKRNMAAGSIALAVVALSGCSLVPDGTLAWDKQKAENLVIENNHVKGELVEDTVYVDADISGTDNNTEWKEYTAQLKNIDEDEADRLSHILLGDSAYLSDTRQDEGKMDLGTQYTYLCDNPDKKFICRKGMLLYDTQKRRDIQYTSFLMNTKGRELDADELYKIYPKDSIDGLDKKEAEELFKSLCDEAGVETSDNYNIYTLDKDSANAYIQDGNEWIIQDKNGEYKPLLTEADEAYIVVAPIVFYGTELPTKDTSSGTGEASKSRIDAVIGRDGLYYYKITGLYDIGDEEPAEGIHDINDLMDYLKTNYQYSGGVTHGIKITDISLKYIVRYYVTQKEYKIVPTYVCTKETTYASEKNGEETKMTSIDYLYVDARTLTSFSNK